MVLLGARAAAEVRQVDHRVAHVAADRGVGHGDRPDERLGGREVQLAVQRGVVVVAAAEDQVAHDHVRGRRDGHALGAARVAAEERRGGGADVGADAVVEGDLLQRLVADDHLGEEVDQEAVARAQAEVRIAGGEHRRRLGGRGDAVDDRQAGAAGAADALTRQAHGLAGREDLLRRAHARVLAAQVQDRGDAHRVDDVEGRHLLDGVHEDSARRWCRCRRRRAPTGGRRWCRGDGRTWSLRSRPSPNVAPLGACWQARTISSRVNCITRLVSGQYAPASAMRSTAASNTRVGERVVGVDDGLFVPLHLVARDHLGELGDVALHVVVGLGGERADLGAIEDLDKVDHVVLLVVRGSSGAVSGDQLGGQGHGLVRRRRPAVGADGVGPLLGGRAAADDDLELVARRPGP